MQSVVPPKQRTARQRPWLGSWPGGAACGAPRCHQWRPGLAPPSCAWPCAGRWQQRSPSHWPRLSSLRERATRLRRKTWSGQTCRCAGAQRGRCQAAALLRRPSAQQSLPGTVPSALHTPTHTNTLAARGASSGRCTKSSVYVLVLQATATTHEGEALLRSGSAVLTSPPRYR